MCLFTNVKELIESRERFIKFKLELKKNNPRQFHIMENILDEIELFMNSSMMHIDSLHKENKNKKNITINRS
jgi:hypothetical protein